MTTATLAPALGRAGFGRALRAEWTKFRTLRGWVLAAVVAAALIDVIGLLLVHDSIGCGQQSGSACYQPLPTGPGGEAVNDTFYFVRQPLTGDGEITVRMTALTGQYLSGPARAGEDPAAPVAAVEPWAKAGLILKAGTEPGSAYAAVAATGSHGLRMQWNFTRDVAGPPGSPAPAAPRWLRLTRAGESITGSVSTDGSTWTTIATARLAGLPATVQVGLFATSPDHLVVRRSFGGAVGTGGPSTATAQFDHVTVSGTTGERWSGGAVLGSVAQGPPRDARGQGSYEQTGDGFTVTGSGDIAPAVAGLGGGPTATTTLEHHLGGVVLGLLVLSVLGSAFATSEYRRGQIRLTLSAVPARGAVLAAKALVAGAVAFAAALVAVGIAVPVGARQSRAAGAYVLPVSAATEARVIVGVAAVIAMGTVVGLALGVIMRRGVAAVAAVVVVVVLPVFLAVASGLPAGAAQWLLRVTPAAGLAMQQSIPRYGQVSADYAPPDYFPLAPWAGFAVLCGYAAAALLLAHVLLRRRDAS